MASLIDWIWNDAFAMWFFAVPFTLLIAGMVIQGVWPLWAGLLAWIELVAFFFGSFWLITAYPLQTFIFLAIALGAAFVWCGLCLFAAMVTKLLS